MKPEELCSGFPEMIEYISYTKKLEFEQNPDYKYLKLLFSRMLKRIDNSNKQLVFSWIKLSEVSNLKNRINLSIRKDSPLNRIYKKIKSNLERYKKQNSEIKNGVYKRINEQTNGTSSNLNVINKKTYSESVSDKKTDKISNKNLLKFREGLNTTIANLDATLVENIDFENEIIKRSERETESDLNNKNGNKININEDNKNFLENKNVIINSNQKNNNFEIYVNN